MEFFVLVLKELAVVGSSVHSLFVALLVSEFHLCVVTGETEDDNAANLDGDVAVLTGGVSSEEGDGGGDHVGAEEGGGVDHELVCVVVAVVAKDNGREELNDEHDIGRGEVAKKESVADFADVGANTDTEDGGVNLFESQATVGNETKDGKTGNG